ncbi:MAG TPA: S-layer homology domain-containing protein [Bacilli bacterium]|nr:S-layer homology domain-containing protein [Bacilli bacterium]
MNKACRTVVSRLSSVTLALAVLAAPVAYSTPVFAAGSTNDSAITFVDVKGHWAESAISALAAKGITNGKSEDRFYPNDSLTRAEFATFLVRALNLPLNQEAPQVFADVPKDSWMYGYVHTAYQNELVNGKSDTVFAPNEKISRQDMAKMIANALQVQQVPDAVKQQVDAFADQGKIADYAKLPVVVASYLGILSGYPDGSFAPLKNATRSEAAKTLYAMINAPKDKLDVLKPPPEEPKPEEKPEPEPVPEPLHDAFLMLSAQDLGIHKPTEPVEITVVLKDEAGNVIAEEDQTREVTMTVVGPDGTKTMKAPSQDGQATFSVAKTKAGSYALSFAAEHATAKGKASFTVIADQATKIDLHAGPSPFVRIGDTIELTVTGLDKWNNPVPVGKVQYKSSDESKGTVKPLIDPLRARLTATEQTGEYTITATSGTFTDTLTIHNYDHAADLVSGKGDWMMWRDWNNYPVQDTIKRLKDAGVTHVYLEVSTSSDGFYGQDSMDSFLPQAHEAGIVVMGWIYANLRDPAKDASQTNQVLAYTTPNGDRFDGLAADLEENLSAAKVEAFSQPIRDMWGTDLPMVAVTYPASWNWIAQPWASYKKYYDVMAPMIYWHYKAKLYNYTDAYNAIKAEMDMMQANTGLPVTIVGQSYNMFDSWQYPQAEEIKGAMQAAKDKGAVGYSTYRGRTATDYEWAEFAKFPW